MSKSATMKKAKSSVKSSKIGKMVYFFGGGKAEGKASMKNLLGGKGANLAEMAGHPSLKLPVPPASRLPPRSALTTGPTAAPIPRRFAPT